MPSASSSPPSASATPSGSSTRRHPTPASASVFGRPIGQNQGVQFPIARAYVGMRAAELMVREAAALYEAGRDCGAEANMAKHARRRGLMGGGGYVRADPRRLRLRRGIRHRAQVSRDQALYGGADLDQSDPLLHSRARARLAAVVLRSHAIVRSPAFWWSRSSRRSPRRCAPAGSQMPGARVIKIERPEGDFARFYDQLAHGESSYFVWLNRGKESDVLDLAKPTTRRCSKQCSRAPTCSCRTSSPAQWPSSAFPVARLRRELSAAHLLLDFRLRRDGPIRDAQGLRSADSGGSRASPRSPARRSRRASAFPSSISPPA